MIPSSAEVMHLAFQFGESHEPGAVVNRQFRMSRNEKHLEAVGGVRVPERKVVPTSGVRQALDVGVKPLSAPF